MNFPYLFTQFKQECLQNNESVDVWLNGLNSVAKSLSLNVGKDLFIDEIFDKVSAEFVNLQKHSKSKVINTANVLFKWILSIKEFFDLMKADISHKTLEYSTNLENIGRSNERLEENYNKLMSEHHKLETLYRELQQANIQLEYKIKELNLIIDHSEVQQEITQKNAEELKKILSEKEKMLKELDRKFKINKGLCIINEVQHESAAIKVKNNQSSMTPKVKSRFSFEKIPDTGYLKDIVIKNLRDQLQTANEKFKKNEENVRKAEGQNKELLEKIRILSVQNYKYLDYDDDDYKVDTIESLRDEIAVLDLDYHLTSRDSIMSLPKLKEIGVQYEIIENQKTKKNVRYSCFSFFG